MREFRPSLRGTVATAAFLAFATWLVLRVALRMDARLATVLTISALAALAALRLLMFRGGHALAPTDEGLVVRDGRTTRCVSWDAIRQIRLAYGEMETPHGVATVQYARLEVSHGTPVAFADLSALDGTEVTIEGEPTPIYDVGDPEVLLGLVAERIGARDFLPRATAPAGRRRRPLIGPLGSLTVALRAGFYAVLVVNLCDVLWDYSAHDVGEIVAGAAAAIALLSATRPIASRLRALRSETDASLIALSVALAAATTAALSGWPADAPMTPAWGLSCALVLSFPVAPLPGAALARTAGFIAARQRTDRLAAILVATVGVAIAVMLSRGMKFLPLGLLAGTAVAVEAYLAELRNARLANAPRFSRWSPEALAELRAMLRAVTSADASERQTELDRGLFARAESLRQVRAVRWIAVVAALVAITAGLFAAHRVVHETTAHASDAIRLLLR